MAVKRNGQGRQRDAPQALRTDGGGRRRAGGPPITAARMALRPAG